MSRPGAIFTTGHLVILIWPPELEITRRGSEHFQGCGFRGRVDRCWDCGWHCGHGFRGRVGRCFDREDGGFGRVRRCVGRDRRRDYGRRRGWTRDDGFGRVRRGSQHGPG